MGNKSSKSVACAQTPEIHGEQIRKICSCAQTPMLVLPAWAFTVKPYTRRRGKWTSPCHIERPVSIFPVIQQRREQDHEAGPRIVDKRARRRRQDPEHGQRDSDEVDTHRQCDGGPDGLTGQDP